MKTPEMAVEFGSDRTSHWIDKTLSKTVGTAATLEVECREIEPTVARGKRIFDI